MAKREPPYRATVGALMNLFFNATREKFAQAGAQGLTRDEVEAIATYFTDGSPELDAYYQRLFAQYDRVNAAMTMNRMRNDEFNRLIVESFEDYLIERTAPKDAKVPPDRLPREILPALFHATRQILGAEFFEKSAKTCRDIRRILEERDGPAFSWDSFFDDEKVIQVQQRALARIVVYFRNDFPEKKKWIVKALNYNSGSDIKGGIASSYLFTEGRLKILLLAMIRRVDASLVSGVALEKLTKNIGEERIKTIERVKMDVKLLDDKRLF